MRNETDLEKITLVVIYHDESIFSTNEGQQWMWGEEERPAILPKMKGSGIMVLDFVKEHGGYLCLTDEEHVCLKEMKPQCPQAVRQTLEHGTEKEGYWTSAQFMQQVEFTADIAKFKYPAVTHTLI